MKAFFEKFAELKPEGQKELEVTLEKPELVVISYEFIEFLKLKDSADFDKYMALKDEFKRIGFGDSTKEYHNQIYELFHKLYTFEHECDSNKVKLYTPRLFMDKGFSEYNATYETDVGQCLNHLLDAAREDFEGMDLDAVKEIIVFSGLYGNDAPIRVADSLAREFGLGEKVVIYSTGYHNPGFNPAAKIIKGERDDIETKVKPLLKLPYVDCRMCACMSTSELRDGK